MDTIRAVDVQVALGAEPQPENVSVYVGDTVTWRALAGIVADTQSHSGEWKSPVFRGGESFSFTFTKAGTYAYRIGWYTESTPPSFLGYNVGTVTVQPLSGARPAVTIAAPPDGFLVLGGFLMQAVVTNVESDVRAVNFFRGEQIIGTVTNSPYEIRVPGDSNSRKTYEFRASVIDNAGQTNFSPPIRVTFDAYKMFKPLRLPTGQFVSFHSGGGSPDCVLWSEDLKTWTDLPIPGQRLGRSTFVDASATNMLNTLHRFYRIVPCL